MVFVKVNKPFFASFLLLHPNISAKVKLLNSANVSQIQYFKKKFRLNEFYYKFKFTKLLGTLQGF
jgi:hypothetical protein